MHNIEIYCSIQSLYRLEFKFKDGVEDAENLVYAYRLDTLNLYSKLENKVLPVELIGSEATIATIALMNK